MRIEFASSTGCPYGQFVVYADTSQDRAILECFLKGTFDKNFQFHKHSQTWINGHIEAFNFGWLKHPKKLNIFQKIIKKVKQNG